MTFCQFNKKHKLFNFILSFLISISLNSQSFEINIENGYSVFSDNGKFLILDKDYLHEYDGYEWIKFQHNLGLDNYFFEAFKNDKKTYLIANGGGKVLNYQNRKLEIADNSNFWHSKYESSSFFRENKLHSFAGYGHYQLRNDLIYFDEKLKEWVSCFEGKNQFNHYNNDSPFLMKHISQYDESEDIFYTGLGHSDKGINSKIYSYNFKTNKWSETGYIDKVFSKYLTINGYNPPSFINLSDKKIYTFDLVNNFYTIQDNSNNLSGSMINVYFDNNSEEFLILTKGVNSKLNYSIFKKSDFFNKNQTLVIFNKKKNLSSYFILLFLLILIPLIIYFRLNRKINFKMISDAKSNFGDSLIKHQIDFLSLILLNHPKPTKFNDFGSLFEFDLAYETKIKKINIAIEKINLIFKKVLSTKSNIVIIDKNKEDSRIKEVRLNLNAKKNKNIF